ncbi:MAG: sugar O-acetyltransferase [Firmicutes bacterium]|uniref:Acetyltransferase n=1 Tax=Candidatus Stercoripulliclostridium pullicola TaxID=2840953 RepID=A0A940DHZ2_9FIRM|nr:sugar O-acetyltransferase [Candidatus Stercoripulliclostridium pullicola]
MTENKERMKKGLIYDPTDKELMKEQGALIARVNEYNATSPAETEKRAALIKEMFAEAGEGCYIEPPFHANWGGKHVRLGNYVYANFNLTLVDDGNIDIGDNVMFAPNVTVITATHPVLPALREKGLQFNVDVKICNNVWIGAGAIIMPGITVGENSVVGAGSVVTKDVPPNTVVVGNPARVLREIGEHDRIYYFKDKKIDIPVE